MPDNPLDENLPVAPEAPRVVHCDGCGLDVEFTGRGLCPTPTCGRFLPGNEVALVTGLRSKKLAKIVDAYRVELIDQMFAERGGREALDVVSRIAIENYALVCAQHKTIEARLDQDGLFTQTGRRRSAFDMLKSISETIDRLRAELPPITVRPVSRGSDPLPSPSEIADRAQALIDAIRHAASVAPDDAAPEEAEWLEAEPVAAPATEAPAAVTAPEPPAPAPYCKFCMRVACVGEDHPGYRTFHGRDPAEIERMTREATAVLMSNHGHNPVTLPGNK